MVVRGRPAEQVAVRRATHQHYRLHSEGKGADMNLRNVGNDARPLAHAVFVERLVAEANLTGLWLEQTKQGLEQGSLAATVRPQQGQDLAGRQSDIQTAADGMVRITDCEIAALDIHDQVLCMLARSQMKNGVPMTAVRMPSGISTSAAVRASVSISSR